MLYKLNYCMYRIAIIFMLVASTALAVLQPYPIGVDSQTRSVPALEMYQAEPFTVRATFRSGGVAEDVSTVTPFMYWATSAGATNYVTSSWSRVNGGTTGVVDFTFSAAALNTNGDLIYGVGAGSTFRQGALKIRANPFASGVASPTFTLATNLAGISFINYPWLDSVSLYEGNSNHAAVSGNGLVFVVRTNYGGGSITSESDPIFVAASNALLTKAQASSLYATGTPVYTESDPLFVAASNALLTKVQAYSLYATGTPLYTISGIGTDTYARTTAEWASNRANAAYSIASAAATGTPIYSVSGLATGTPLYAYTESDPLWSAASNAYYTAAQANTRFATGTPLYVESNPSLAALSNDVAAASATGTAAHVLATLVSGRVAAVESAGYAVNGHNITGRWFAVENTNSGINAWVGGGYANSVTGSYASVGGGYNNSAAGSFASVFGGYANIADGLDASVGGGYKNSASGSFASVCGGYQNSAAGYAASVGGGWQNSSAGLYSTIPGGRNNYAGNYAFAAGTGARATNDGSFVVSLPGDTNATFGSRADNSFNVLSVGGAYFLSSGLWIQDTNGNTIAAFTPTNSTLSGTLNLTGYATTGAVSSQVSASGLGATNFGLAIGAGATALVAQASAAGTNFAMAIGAGNSNLTLSAWETASNGLATARAAQVQASNINAGAWSQIATNTITAPSNSAVRIGLSLGLSGEAMLGQASAIARRPLKCTGGPLHPACRADATRWGGAAVRCIQPGGHHPVQICSMARGISRRRPTRCMRSSQHTRRTQ